MHSDHVSRRNDVLQVQIVALLLLLQRLWQGTLGGQDICAAAAVLSLAVPGRPDGTRTCDACMLQLVMSKCAAQAWLLQCLLCLNSAEGPDAPAHPQ